MYAKKYFNKQKRLNRMIDQNDDAVTARREKQDMISVAARKKPTVKFKGFRNVRKEANKAAPCIITRFDDDGNVVGRVQV